jgi:two-component system, OmpR family, response regulator AdeR
MARILAADDSAVLRKLMQGVLTASGHEVFVVSDGLEVLAQIEGLNPDILVLDLEMPNLDGYGVLTALRRQGLLATTKVLMLTARQLDADWLKCYRMGAHQYVTKPFDADDLQEAVAELHAMTMEQVNAARVVELEKSKLLAGIESAFA